MARETRHQFFQTYNFRQRKIIYWFDPISMHYIYIKICIHYTYRYNHGTINKYFFKNADRFEIIVKYSNGTINKKLIHTEKTNQEQ